MPERFGNKNDEKEYRTCGRFGSAEIRALINAGTDPRTLGCPDHIFLNVLERRDLARRRQGKPIQFTSG